MMQPTSINHNNSNVPIYKTKEKNVSNQSNSLIRLGGGAFLPIINLKKKAVFTFKISNVRNSIKQFDL